MKRMFIAMSLLAAATLAATPALAQGSRNPRPINTASMPPATIYVVHGIPGDGGFPVEVCVSGTVAIDNFQFTNYVGPIALPAGTYSISVRADTPAGAGASCNGPFALGPVNLTFASGVSYSVVAHLTDDEVPTASVFTNDLSGTDRGKARVILHHTAAAPEVTVKVARDWYDMWSPTAMIPDFANGDQEAAQLRPGDWQAGLLVGADTVFGPATLQFQPFTTYLYYAVGVFPDTFNLVAIEVPGTK
jgi:hypothetical protein